jgi:hypothetical protein
MTVMMKAWMIIAAPIPGVTTRTGVPRAPPRAASMEPKAKTPAKTRGTLTPRALAISRSAAVARTMRPHHVRSKSAHRPTATTTPTPITNAL